MRSEFRDIRRRNFSSIQIRDFACRLRWRSCSIPSVGSHLGLRISIFVAKKPSNGHCRRYRYGYDPGAAIFAGMLGAMAAGAFGGYPYYDYGYPYYDYGWGGYPGYGGYGGYRHFGGWGHGGFRHFGGFHGGFAHGGFHGGGFRRGGFHSSDSMVDFVTADDGSMRLSGAILA